MFETTGVMIHDPKCLTWKLESTWDFESEVATPSHDLQSPLLKLRADVMSSVETTKEEIFRFEKNMREAVIFLEGGRVWKCDDISSNC